MPNRHRHVIYLVAVTALSCGGRTIDDESSSLDTPTDVPTETAWSACFMRDEYATCAEVCALENTICVESGCPALPDYCLPDEGASSCDMATYVVGTMDVICTDVNLGGFIDKSCDEPIEWQVNSIGRCCCAI